MISVIRAIFRTVADACPYKVLSLSVGEGLAPPAISKKRAIFRGVKGAAPYQVLSSSVGAIHESSVISVK